MASTVQVRAWWSDKRCTYGVKMKPALTWGRSPVRCQIEWVPASTALFHVIIASGYVPESDWPIHGWVGSARYCPAGIGGHTCQESGAWCSLHNYVVGTFDIEYDKNPYLRVTRPDPDWMFARCKFTRENIEAIEAIRFNNGEQAFRWLGWAIGDTMHIQGNASKDATASGIDWSTVLGWTGEPIQLPTNPPPSGNNGEGVMMAYARKGDKSEAVVEIQTFLVLQGYDLGDWGPAGDGADGVWGSDTTEAVLAWQNAHNITEYNFVAKIAFVRGDYFGPRSAGFATSLTGGGAGSVGPTGPKGDTGAQGPRGDDGIDGEDGTDGVGIEPGTVIRLATEATIL